jgi:hypothetical protein
MMKNRGNDDDNDLTLILVLLFSYRPFYSPLHAMSSIYGMFEAIQLRSF